MMYRVTYETKNGAEVRTAVEATDPIDAKNQMSSVYKDGGKIISVEPITSNMFGGKK